MRVNLDNIELASYLPVPRARFIGMFGVAIDSGEITHTEVAATEDDRELVVGFYMNGKHYACQQRIEQLRAQFGNQQSH